MTKIKKFVMSKLFKIPNAKNVENHNIFVEGFWPEFHARGRFMKYSISSITFLVNSKWLFASTHVYQTHFRYISNSNRLVSMCNWVEFLVGPEFGNNIYSAVVLWQENTWQMNFFYTELSYCKITSSCHIFKKKTYSTFFLLKTYILRKFWIQEYVLTIIELR